MTMQGTHKRDKPPKGRGLERVTTGVRNSEPDENGNRDERRLAAQRKRRQQRRGTR